VSPEDGAGEPPVGTSTPEAVALAGKWAGKTLRAIAVDLYGREHVDANWYPDGPLRSKVRRLLYRAVARAGTGPDTA